MKKICFLFLMLFAAGIISSNALAAEAKEKKEPERIAFCQHDGRYWQIWTIALDGSNRKQLADSGVDKRSPDFSSDGKKIVYVSNTGELWVMDNSGNNKTRIPLNISAAEPKWCFGDKKIVFTSYRGISFLDDSDIWMVDNDGLNLEKIIRRPSIQFLPDVSKDSQEIVFVDVLESFGHEIFRFNFKTKDYVQLTQDDSRHTTPVFAAGGEKIVYSSNQDDSYDIWSMDKFGRNQKNLTHRPAFDSSPVVSKDGETVFFLSDRTKGMQIWSMGINGENLKLITDDAGDKQDISVYTPEAQDVQN